MGFSRNSKVVREVEAQPGRGKTYTDTYTHVRKLGSGGQGETAVVKRQRDGRLFVRKSQKEFSVIGDKPREMFIFEEILKPHSSIVGFDHGNYTKKEGTLILYFEHCEGGDLGSFIPRGNPVSEDFIWHCFIQIAEALEYLHYGTGARSTPHHGWRRVVHCDVKPYNVFLRKPLTSKNLVPDLVLGDFGLATLREPYKSGGTPDYMAPESLEGGVVTKQSDVWCLGATIHALAHGFPPVTGTRNDWKNRSAWLKSPESRKAKAMSTFYSDDLNRCMMDCLLLNPHKRISSQDLVRNLHILKPRHLR